MENVHENHGYSSAPGAQWDPTTEDSGGVLWLRGAYLFQKLFMDELPAAVDDPPPHGMDLSDEATYDLYEQNCPYRQTKFPNRFRPTSEMFRLVEEFPDGAVYRGDSFGDHSYIDTDENRACSLRCPCRLHGRKPDAFSFTAYKSPNRLAIVIHSIYLYSELVRIIGIDDMRLEATSQGFAVNGLILLKHYETLDTHLNNLHSRSPTEYLLISEMALLIRGFLLDGQVFKSYGYENLYEDGFLTYDHWKDFQQVQLERDISSLEEAYYAADEIDYFKEGSSVPSAQGDSPSLPAEEAFSGDIHMDDENIRLPQLGPHVAPASDAQPSLHNPPPLESGRHHASSPSSTTEDNREGRSPRDQQSGADSLDGSPSLVSLVEAATAGDESMVRSLLCQRFDTIISYLSQIDSALIGAAREGHESVVRLLLDWGAAPNYYSRLTGSTPLIEAAKAGHESVVRLLLDRGAPINSPSRLTHSTPLMEAIKAGHELVIQLLQLTEARKAGYGFMIQFLINEGPTFCDSDYHFLPQSKFITEILQKTTFMDDGDTVGQRRQTLSLYRHFRRQHLNLKEKAKTSLTSFQNLSTRFQAHRQAWAHGISTLRKLCNGEPPRNLDDTIVFLCVSKAISESLDENRDCHYTTQFNQDLDRWQILFASDKASLSAYREAVRMMWGVTLDRKVACPEQAFMLETLTYFQALASTMVRQARGLLGFRSPSDKGLEISQQHWRLRESRTPRTGRHSTPLPDSRALPPMAMHPKPPDPPPPPEGPLRQEIDGDGCFAKINPTVVLLMAGAIFAIVIIFLTLRRNALAMSSCFPTIALKKQVSQQLDIKHAIDNITNRLQQLAPTKVRAVARLKIRLSCVLESNIITCFSELKQAFADHTCPKVLDCPEPEAQAIKQKAQEACDYYNFAYTLQEHYRILETYLSLGSHLNIVPMQILDPEGSSIDPDALNIENNSRQFYFRPAETETTKPTQTPEMPCITQAQVQNRLSPHAARNARTTFCEDCQRNFSSTTNYGKHLRDKHSGERFSCRFCKKHFSRKAYRDIHEKGKHTRC